MKKTVLGREFSKRAHYFFQDLDKYEEFTFNKARVQEETQQLEKEIIKSRSFFNNLTDWEIEFQDHLRKKGLPWTARVCVDKQNYKNWKMLPPPPNTPKRLEAYEKHFSPREHEAEMVLHDFLILFGYSYDGKEHLYARMITYIYEIRHALKRGHTIDIDKAFNSTYLLGAYSMLQVVYEKQDKDRSKGGEGADNPWKEYGKQLRGKYPDKSATEIWQQIFRDARREARQCDKEAFSTPEIEIAAVSDWDICADIGTKEREEQLVAHHTHKPSKTIKFNSFRRYLQR